MAHSRESEALRRSYKVFKKGVDPDAVVTVLYSELLLTPEEKGKVTQETQSPAQQLDKIFECMERRVSADPSVFHKLVQVLLEEPALKGVGVKMQDHYNGEQSQGATSDTTSPPPETCMQLSPPPLTTSANQLISPESISSAQPEQHIHLSPSLMPPDEPTQPQGLSKPQNTASAWPHSDRRKKPLVEVSNDTGVPNVKAQIHDFEMQFDDLKTSTREDLELRSIDVKLVAERLTSLPANDMPEHKLFLEAHIDKLFQADSHLKLFAHMNLHWNYLAYHLLEHLIKKLSVKEVKGGMEKYKSDLQEFMWSTPLKLFCDAQTKREVELPQGFRELVVKFPWPDNVTLGVVDEFRQQYACHYKLHDCAMIIITIHGGSFTVVWHIPESIIQHLRKEVPEHILSRFEATRLEIAGICVYEQVPASSVSAFDNPPSEVTKEKEATSTSRRCEWEEELTAVNSHEKSCPYPREDSIQQGDMAQPSQTASIATCLSIPDVDMTHREKGAKISTLAGSTTDGSPKGAAVKLQAATSTHQEYEFVELPDDLRCPITCEPLVYPHQTLCCGNALSVEAVIRLQIMGQSCPYCRGQPLISIPDKHLYCKVREQKIYCPNKKEGCKWVGKLANVETHKMSISCPIKNIPMQTHKVQLPQTSCSAASTPDDGRAQTEQRAEVSNRHLDKAMGYNHLSSKDQSNQSCYISHETSCSHFLQCLWHGRGHTMPLLYCIH